MKLRNIIFSWDFLLSAGTALALLFFLPSWIKASFASSFYTVGITVLSIVFSLFFAALAIIMSSTDNEFILYMEEGNHFTTLLKSFKFTLVLLFISLLYSIIAFLWTDYILKNLIDNVVQHKIFIIIFAFLFCYSLLATAFSVKDTILFSQFRTRYLQMIQENSNKKKNNGDEIPTSSDGKEKTV